MRTSGRGNFTETFLFVAPVILFGGFFMWAAGGDPMDVVRWVDRTAVHVTWVAWTWCATVVEAITKG